MIAEEDKNGDGVIDREEFFSMLEKKKNIEASTRMKSQQIFSQMPEVKY